MGSGGGSSTTVQKADPWSGQQPYLREIFSEAQNMYRSGTLAPSFYPGQTVAQESPWTQQARAMQAERALGGSASIDKAQSAMDEITAGRTQAANSGLGVLNGMAASEAGAGNAGLAALNSMATGSDPYLKSLYADAAGEVGASIDSGFSSAGRYGSGAHANARADALADLAGNMYTHAYDQRLSAAQAASGAYNEALALKAQAAQQAGQLYDSGVSKQVLGAGMAQELANQSYRDAAALSEAGAAQDDYLQQLINAEIERWNYDQQAPITALNNYQRLVSGQYGGTTTTSGQKSGTGSGALGNMVKGAALGSSIGGLPGSIIGAVGGGLLSLF